MDKEIEYFIKNHWLFDENFESTKYNQIVKALENKVGDLRLCYVQPKQSILPEYLLNFEQLIFSLPEDDIKSILQYFSGQMQMLIANKVNGVIPWFINQIGSRVYAILEAKKQKEKK